MEFKNFYYYKKLTVLHYQILVAGTQMIMEIEEPSPSELNFLNEVDLPLPLSCTQIKPLERQQALDVENYSFNILSNSVKEETLGFQKQEEEKNSFKENVKKLNFLAMNCRAVENCILNCENIPLFQEKIGYESEEKQNPEQDQSFDKMEEEAKKTRAKYDEEDNESQSNQMHFHYPLDETFEKSFCDPGEIVINNEALNNFILFRNQVKILCEKTEKIAKQNEMFENQRHTCKVCGIVFANGRQLGGHMSRKHPGNSVQYSVKKNTYKVKAIERNRRKMFVKEKNKVVPKKQIKKQKKKPFQMTVIKEENCKMEEEQSIIEEEFVQ